MDARFDFGSFLRSLPQPDTPSSQAADPDAGQATSAAPSVSSNGPSRQPSNVRPAAARSGSTAGSVGLSVEDKLAARAYSGAANALAAAAAAGPASDTRAAASEGVGVIIPSNVSTFEYDTAQLNAGEQKAELKMSPVTVVITEPYLEMQQRIAVNSDFICYSLRAGQIRVLHKHTAARTLLKGAAHPPAVKFASNSCSTLASVDKSGQVFVWDIAYEDESVDATLIGTFILSHNPGSVNAVHPDGTPVSQAQVAIHAKDSQPILAMALGQTMYLAQFDKSDTDNPASTWDCTDTSSPKESIQLSHSLRYLAFSPSGDKLAAVDSTEQVLVWPLRDDGNGGIINMESFLEFHANPEAACNTVHWLSSTTIVVGSAKNSIVSLWRVSDTAECLQTVKIISKQESGSTENYLHMAVQPEAGIIVLASAKSPAVYALHINNTADTVTLDYLAEFAVGMPILSLAADYMPSHDSDAVQLYCVQEKGIQMYTLNLAQCQPTPLFKAPSSALSEAASALPVLGSQNQPSESQLAEPQHSESQLSTPADPQKASSQHGASAQADQQQQSLQEAAGSLPGLPMRISTRPAVSLPDQPKLLTPKHLMQHAKRSASQQSISSLTGQQTPKSERASSSQAWDSLSNMGGEVPRSAGTAPGSTRSQVDNTDAVSTTSTQGSLLTPGDLSRPASAMSNSAGLPSAAALDAILKQKSPAASPAGSRSSTPPPSTPALPSAAYLTPEQYSGGPAAPPASDDAAPATPASPTAAAANDSSRNLFAEHLPNQAASPVQDSSSVKLLQRQVAAEADSDPMPSASRETSSAFEQPLDLLPVSNAATLSPPSAVQQLDPASAEGSTSQAQQQQRGQSQQAQQQQLSAPSLQSPAEPSQQAELSEGSVRRVVDAVAERTLAQQKRMLGYLHDGHREMLRIIKADIAKEGKRLQAAIEAQVSTLTKSQGSLMAEDRRAVVAEQQANMEKLVGLISASINRDLPLRMEELVRAEVAILSSGLQQQLSPVVQTAIAEALPEQFVSPQLRNAMEASLNSQLQQALAKPLQDSFTASFQQQLIPAFEGACRDMFAQVQATFAGGLSEHLQAAGGANASVAASLRESLGTAAQLVTDLKTDLQEGQSSLLQLASQRSGNRLSGFDNQEAHQDPKQEYMSLIRDQRYEEAFHAVLSLEDVSMVAWLCSQLDPGSLLSQKPPLLSQQLLLPLIQQLGTHLSKDTLTKLKWLQSTALALNPQDPALAPHVRPILDYLYRSLQQILAESSSREASNQAQICLHLVNSLLHSCPS